MKRSLDSRVDYSLLLPVFFLLVIGVVAIYIAVSHDYPNNILPILGSRSPDCLGACDWFCGHAL